jgi:5-methylcytosine-specific restriction protein A
MASPRPSAAARGYGVHWQRIRASYLRRHPICEEPDCDQASTDVDHIDGRGPRGDNRDVNLRAYCHSHHSRKTATQDGGFGKKIPRTRPPEAHPGLISTP